MSLRIQDPIFYIPVTFPLLFFYEPIIKNRIQDRFLYSRYIPVTFLLGTNPSSRIQERTHHQEFKNEPVIKNSRSFFIFPLHSRYFSFRNEPIIKNSRTNPSSRIQDKGTRLRECKMGTKNEPIIKNSRTNPSSRIQE